MEGVKIYFGLGIRGVFLRGFSLNAGYTDVG